MPKKKLQHALLGNQNLRLQRYGIMAMEIGAQSEYKRYW